jgi:two-component system, cell cycle sensor histidine kinase and response regulator CckA
MRPLDTAQDARDGTARGPMSRVVIPYALFSGLWIVLSDRLLAVLVSDPVARTQWSIYKGWAFVVVTAAVLYGLLRVELRARDRERQARRESEERMRFALQASHTGGWELDLESHEAQRTLEHARIFGYDTLLPGWSYEMFLEHVLPEDRAAVDRGFREATQARANWSFECRIRRADGEIRWIWVAGGHQHNGVGQVRRIAGIVQDVTDRKRAEEERLELNAELGQAQKMDSIGRLAGGVAHDFNNALGVILGHSELAMRELAAEDPLRHHLEEMRDAAARSAHLTRQLLAFARKQTIAPRVLDLNEAVSGMLAMLRRLIGENIQLDWQPAAGLWSVKMDPAQVDQILANLLVNARDAIAGVGRITVETRNVMVEAGEGHGPTARAPGDYVRLSVSDEGAGMDPDVLAHVFEPFFTTKPVGQGTGLGLATVYGIVTQNAGFVDVESEPGEGSRFRIHLPRVVAQVEPDVAASADDEPGGQGETILLVEDDPAMLEITAEILESLGYLVLRADKPSEALRLAPEHPEIRLLVSDVVMPEMNGRELANRLVASRPGTRCLFVSGYTSDVIAHHGVLDDGILFLAKPFARRDLALKVREALGD